MADLLPCDGDGVCMVCKVVPPDSDVLLCNSCVSPWHMACLKPPLESVPVGDWFCPDCSLHAENENGGVNNSVQYRASSSGDGGLIAQIRAIQDDPNLTEAQKAKKRQELMSSGGLKDNKVDDEEGDVKDSKRVRGPSKQREVLDMFDESLKCIFCMQLSERPVTTPCGHNFCLKCFQKWMTQGKKNCAKCRSPIPSRMASQPRINSALVMAIRMAKAAAANASDFALRPPKVYEYVPNQNKPDKAFMTERAKRKGLSNAASGRIFVTVPPDHFGPILAENDPERNQGVLVGECWADRMECRQWGAHLPHVAGISGQSDYGAQSVALSGGYEDDEDHGEWFLYTGSGGRDLSGNKRTNKDQSFDQTFEKFNEALRVSCKMGYPVRVVRSHKEKRSSYAPESGIRYDGIYRIEQCWRKKGIQGFKVCRYLFVRCDNEPAPWTSDETGDQPRPLPIINELKNATDVTVRKHEPGWDWKDGRWGWTRDPPPSRKLGSLSGRCSEDGSRKRGKAKHQFLTIKQKLLKEFSCSLCNNVMTLPISTPCGHNFCKACLEGLFVGQQDVRERGTLSGRSLRAQKIVKKCPSCEGDITDFLLNPQVNRQMEDIIRSLKDKVEDECDSDGNDKEDGEQLEGIDNEEMETVECEVEQMEDSKESKDTLDISTKVTESEGLVEHQETGMSDKKVYSQAGKRSLNPEQEKAINGLHSKYPRYSVELLQSMLADQDGDLKELESLLRALQRQETKANRGVSNSTKSKTKNTSDTMPEKDPDAKVFNQNDRKRKAVTPEPPSAKLRKSGNNSIGTSSKSGGMDASLVKNLDANNSENSCKNDITDPEKSSPPRQQSASNGEIKSSSRKKGRDTSSPVVKVYRTRHRLSSNTKPADNSTPQKGKLTSASPSSPLVVESDSDFE